MNALKKFFLSLLGVIVAVPIAVTTIDSAIASVTGWLDSMPAIQRLAYSATLIVLAVFVLDRFLDRGIGYSPLGIIILVAQLLTTSTEPKSGREMYDESPGNQIRRVIERGGLAVDDVYKTNAKGGPKLEESTSVALNGQTGYGKSSTMKDLMTDFDDSNGIIAHAMAEHDDGNKYAENEFERFATDIMGLDCIRVSTQQSSHRWNPFLDFNQSISDMLNVASLMMDYSEANRNGWSSAAQNLLACGLIVANLEYNDIARLPDVLAVDDPSSLVDTVNKLPSEGAERPQIVTQAVPNDDDSLQTVQNVLLSSLSPQFASDLFDPRIDAFGIKEFFENPVGRAVILNNWQSDNLSQPFYRFMIQSAIDFAMEGPNQQQFLLDELNKLPPIGNLEPLASAGRSAGARGIIAFQNVEQMTAVYGHDDTESIWSNCPNRFSFKAGNRSTAEFVINSLEEEEMLQRTVSKSEHGDETYSESFVEQSPLTRGDIIDQTPGEALVQSGENWWLCNLTDPGY